MKTFLDTLSAACASVEPRSWGLHPLEGPGLRLLVVPAPEDLSQANAAAYLNLASRYFPSTVEVLQLASALLKSVREDDGKFYVDVLALSQLHNSIAEIQRGA